MRPVALSLCTLAVLYDGAQEKQMSASIRVRMKLHSVAGTYMIRSVDRQHEGRYICVISNTLGKIELPVNVTVLGTTVHDV